MARPTKLTDKTRKAICRSVRNGAPLSDAAAACGVDRSAVFRWLKRDVSLRADVQKARAQFLDDNLKIVKRAAPKNWQAAAWLLERRRPRHFRKRDEVRQKISGRVQVEVTEAVVHTRAEARDLLSRLPSPN